MNPEEKLRITAVATAKIAQLQYQTYGFDFDLNLTIGLIAQLQLAFRHPKNIGPTRQRLEEFVRAAIEDIDPEKGEIYQFLMMGFDEANDQ